MITTTHNMNHWEIVIGLEKLLHKRKAELLEKELKPMSIEKFNDDIEQSLENAKNGEVISGIDLKSKIKKWSLIAKMM